MHRKFQFRTGYPVSDSLGEEIDPPQPYVHQSSAPFFLTRAYSLMLYLYYFRLICFIDEAATVRLHCSTQAAAASSPAYL